MSKMLKTKPPMYQIEAFRKGVKPGLYEVFPGKFKNGKLKVNFSYSVRPMWRKYFREYRKLLQEYPFVHAEREIDGDLMQVFYIYHENLERITPEILRDAFNHHEEIGRAIGIPDFAVKEFAARKTSKGLYTVKIVKLGLVFTLEKKDDNLKKLKSFLKAKGLQMQDAEIF